MIYREYSHKTTLVLSFFFGEGTSVVDCFYSIFL